VQIDANISLRPPLSKIVLFSRLLQSHGIVNKRKKQRAIFVSIIASYERYKSALCLIHAASTGHTLARIKNILSYSLILAGRRLKSTVRNHKRRKLMTKNRKLEKSPLEVAATLLRKGLDKQSTGTITAVGRSLSHTIAEIGTVSLPAAFFHAAH